jgi:hypothetical protein
MHKLGMLHQEGGEPGGHLSGPTKPEVVLPRQGKRKVDMSLQGVPNVGTCRGGGVARRQLEQIQGSVSTHIEQKR